MPDETPLENDKARLRSSLATFLDRLPLRPQLLALGEPNHDVDAFPAQRNLLFSLLAEEHGFRSIALESDVVAGLRVNAHVTSGEGTTDEVMGTGFSHGFGARPANRALVAWMRSFNAGREPADQLRFYGFDAPLENLWAASPRQSLLALHTFLTRHLGPLPVSAAELERLCGDDERWTDPAAALDPSKSIGDSSEARRLQRLIDGLVSRLETETPYLVSQSGFWEAQLHARTAAGLLRYHAVIAGPVPLQLRVTRMLALRDLMMADNLSAIAEREAPRGPTLVFAHDTHMHRQPSTMTMRGLKLEWWGAGAHMDVRLGQRYAYMPSDWKTQQRPPH
ncbi:erythromycin esterase [Deinococcus irradiatisoli]|uniref:Erythromycin esterase n=1 Tax=Deinococcus irradiatisoli TaxID=2202254 RepID=A0A2Z3JEH2_9DEIO|nr:erythromycin esterase family protein [Deinococcus irradiatisoli]AWN23365.1 erythromycin esterase [Deinococcus irradiatisoli]